MHVLKVEVILLLLLLGMGAIEGGDDVGIRGKNEEKIFVSVRLRPLNQKEIARNDVSDWECINDNTIIYKDDNVFMPDRSVCPTAYKFDRVFGSNCSTRQVYKEGVREVALSVVNGINSSIFAHGQTSSGKTYTMTGITEYTIADIYDYMNKHAEREYLLKFSAMEIYNESVKDLLSTDSTPLRLLDDPQRGTTVEKLTEATVHDWNHVRELLSVCEAQRRIGETSFNETSSRSHQIIRLTIESSARNLVCKDNSSTLIAAVNFVDLTGSERASQSLSACTRLKEGSHINQSLLTLGTVIRRLSNGRNGHVPYRDSKLTHILQSSLGGNARTAIICTLSPARSHVEQSRNTLSFASCAKEVSTDAHVNVIISDKALVNHLQRELARMETELSSPRSTFSESRFSAILREKDFKIEKLEKEVKYLKMQLDAAESEVHNLLQQMGDEGRTPSRVGYSPYPHLRIHQSPNDEQPLQDISRTSRRYQPSDVYSSSSFDNSYVELPGVNDYLRNDTPMRILISASQFSEGESTQDMEESDGTFEDVFKEFMDKYLDVGYLSTEDNTEISPRMPFQEVENEHQKEVSVASQEDGGVVYPPIRRGGRYVSPLLKVNRQVLKSQGNECSEFASAWTTESSKLSNQLFVIPSPELPSSQHEQMKNHPMSGSLNLKRGATIKPGLSISLSSPWLENENDENKPPKGSKNSDKHVDDSDSSAGTVTEIELKARRQGMSTHSNISSNTGTVDTEIRAKFQHDDTASDNVTQQVNETEATSIEPMKSNKDVNTDPVQECLRRRANWPLEFKKLQREIIKLWGACNVSLVHRSHFFLLFKGDPSDSIYMEVELRRLLFLKDTFTHGNQTVKDGHVLTLASSAKALLRERQMLAAEMQKQLSGVERETLFVEWGVPLDGKYRRLRLVNLLWSDTEDMDHITCSANVVSKLVDHPIHEKNFKEMFSFNFAHWGSRKPRGLKDSLTSIM